MDEHSEKQIQNALTAIKQLELEKFVKNFDGDNGFMWSSDARVKQIGNKLESDGHSGASFALTLRECARRLNKEPETKAPKIKPPEPPNDNIKIVTDKVYNSMDDNNKKAVDIMVTEGIERAIEHMFIHPKTGEPMDYSTMRSYYG
tara:strand:- start:686 stop:1123 length:438 start_codon:yes stop_codon:yes gene_type:complete